MFIHYDPAISPLGISDFGIPYNPAISGHEWRQSWDNLFTPEEFRNRAPLPTEGVALVRKRAYSDASPSPIPQKTPKNTTTDTPNPQLETETTSVEIPQKSPSIPDAGEEDIATIHTEFQTLMMTFATRRNLLYRGHVSGKAFDELEKYMEPPFNAKGLQQIFCGSKGLRSNGRHIGPDWIPILKNLNDVLREEIKKPAIEILVTGPTYTPEQRIATQAKFQNKLLLFVEQNPQYKRRTTENGIQIKGELFKELEKVAQLSWRTVQSVYQGKAGTHTGKKVLINDETLQKITILNTYLDSLLQPGVEVQ